MSKDQALEAARCARINLDNMVKMMPILGRHPLLPTVEAQMEECITQLEEIEVETVSF